MKGSTTREIISLLDSSSEDERLSRKIADQTSSPVIRSASGKRRLPSPLITSHHRSDNINDIITHSTRKHNEEDMLVWDDAEESMMHKRGKPQHLSSEETRPQANRRLSSETNTSRKWQPFYLTTVPMLSQSHNRHSLTFADLFLFEDDNAIVEVLLMNYMVDLHWMMEQSPVLLTCSSVLCLHGSAVDPEIRPDNWTIAKVDLGRETYGTHHSKLAIIRYHKGIRVVITTANFIEEDFTYRTQGIFVQDFPKKIGHASCAFEDDLLTYLEHIHASTKVENMLHGMIKHMKSFDYSSAEVILLPSVPGRHYQQHRFDYGIGKLHKVLQSEGLLTSEEEYKVNNHDEDRLLLQFSSLGSMGKDAKLVQDYLHLMYFNSSHQVKASVSSSSSAKNKTALQHVDIVWPTLQCVKESFQGYASGGSLPCALKNMYDVNQVQATRHFQLGNVQAGFRPYLRRWDGHPSGRQRATPHMKCYFRYHILQTTQKVEMRWFVLTSCNLSQAAWGIFQSNDSQLYIKSYEMGVLFLPNRITTTHRRFSCTPNHSLLGVDDNYGSDQSSSRHHSGYKFLVSMNPTDYDFDGEDGKISIPFPVPFAVPPASYQASDQPWVWDVPFPNPDCLGNSRTM